MNERSRLRDGNAGGTGYIVGDPWIYTEKTRQEFIEILGFDPGPPAQDRPGTTLRITSVSGEGAVTGMEVVGVHRGSGEEAIAGAKAEWDGLVVWMAGVLCWRARAGFAPVRPRGKAQVSAFA